MGLAAICQPRDFGVNRDTNPLAASDTDRGLAMTVNLRSLRKGELYTSVFTSRVSSGFRQPYITQANR